MCLNNQTTCRACAGCADKSPSGSSDLVLRPRTLTDGCKDSKEFFGNKLFDFPAKSLMRRVMFLFNVVRPQERPAYLGLAGREKPTTH